VCHATSGIYGSIFDVITRSPQQKYFSIEPTESGTVLEGIYDINILGDEMPLLNVRIIKFEINF